MVQRPKDELADVRAKIEALLVSRLETGPAWTGAAEYGRLCTRERELIAAIQAESVDRQPAAD